MQKLVNWGQREGQSKKALRAEEPVCRSLHIKLVELIVLLVRILGKSRKSGRANARCLHQPPADAFATQVAFRHFSQGWTLCFLCSFSSLSFPLVTHPFSFMVLRTSNYFLLIPKHQAPLFFVCFTFNKPVDRSWRHSDRALPRVLVHLPLESSTRSSHSVDVS